VIKEEEIRQFIKKVHKMISIKESIKKIQVKMVSILVRVLYSLYLTRVKKEMKLNTKEELKKIR